MTDVVLVDRLGDINFGLPEDLAPHKKPWAYYELLGIDRNASPQDIKKAIRRLSLENHPDKFANRGEEAQREAGERQKLINEISDVLLDDGGEIGEEWSRRRLYDRISGYGDFFGAVHIEHKSYRTVTVAENLLDLLELEKRGVEAEHQFKTTNPEVTEEIKRLEAAAKRQDGYAARQSHRKIVEALAAKEGITPAEFERKQREAYEEHQKRKSERDRENRKFADGLLSELKQNGTPTETTAEVEAHKVFDIWYNSEKGGYATVTFGTSSYPYCSIVGFKESDGVVKLGLKDSATLSGMRKVHFKTQHANVKITDAHLEGIFQVVNGRVTVEYEGSSYGTVIRVRAPNVNASSDFIQHGDLYVPKFFASEGWEEREPKVDIAVFDGTVDLRMKQKVVQQRMCSYGGYSSVLGSKSLENLIIKDSDNIIKKNYNY